MPLISHPSTPNGAVRGLSASAELADGMLHFKFMLDADLARLRVPPPAPPRAMDRLWQHTCFEAFVAAVGSSAYHEFNFSPSGHWAAYAFRGYRDAIVLPSSPTPPRITLQQAEGLLQLDASIAFTFKNPPSVPLQIGIAAVLEQHDGALSYWALRHLPGKPDFHHRDAFALELEWPNLRAPSQSTR